MKLMLPLSILLLALSFENIVALYNFLEKGETKEYKRNVNSFSIKNLTLDGYLGNGESKEYTSNGYCIYLDKLEFDKELTEIKVKVTVHEGIFTEKVMYYLGSDEEKKQNEKVEFNLSMEYDESDEGSYSHDKLYSKYTYIFKIPILENKYIYVSIPDATLTSDGYVEISVNKKFPGWAIALIVIGSVGFLAVIITILCITECCEKNLFDECKNCCCCCYSSSY